MNLIPQFIAERYERGERTGTLEAAVLFIDISGFTALTESLMRRGKEGAEVLTSVLNATFARVIDAIHGQGGFVAGFAGDALTAIFPVTEGGRAGDAVKAALVSAFSSRDLFRAAPPGGGITGVEGAVSDVSAKAGISFGKVEWGIVGDGSRSAYYFRGPAVDGSAACEHECGSMDLVIDGMVRALAPPDLETTTIGDGLHLAPAAEAAQTWNGATPGATAGPLPAMSPASLAAFAPTALAGVPRPGEFRTVVSVFVSFAGFPGFEELDRHVTGVLREVDRFGGYFNKLDFGDKGGTYLVFFGAPSSHEDDIRRAVEFAQALRTNHGDRVRAGIACGPVYAGPVGNQARCEYTCIGDIVNLSARLMASAEPGSFRISDVVAASPQNGYQSDDEGYAVLKGLTGPVRIRALSPRPRSGAPSPFDGAMVGREAELEAIRTACLALPAGRPGGIIYLYGEPGMGKSRLAREALDPLRERFDICPLPCDALLGESLSPFARYLEGRLGLASIPEAVSRKAAFERGFEVLERDIGRAADARKAVILGDLRRAKPFVGTLLGVRMESRLDDLVDAKLRFENTVYAIKGIFKGLSLARPVVLLVEDMHAIDEDSRKAFEVLTRNIDAFPILVFATARYGDDGSRPVLKTDAEVAATAIALDRLSDVQVGRLVEAESGAPADPSLVGAVAGRSEGNPFFVQQFCRYLAENGLVEIEGGTCRLRRADFEMPGSIEAIIVARIDRLSAEVKEAVAVASVLGMEFELDVLSALLRSMDGGFGTEEVKGIVGEGVAERIWDRLLEMRCMFSHALLRDTVYGMQMRGRLRELHAMAAAALKDRFAPRRERHAEIAYHFDRAGMAAEAIPFLESAGDYAFRCFANGDALRSFERALELLEAPPAAIAERLGILLKKAEVLDQVGKRDAAAETLASGIALCRKAGGDRLLGAFLQWLGRVQFKKGEYDAAISTLAESRILSERTGDKANLIQCLLWAGNAHREKGSFAEALRLQETALAMSRELGDRKTIASASNALGVVHRYMGAYERALERHRESLSIAEELDDKPGMAAALNDIVGLHSDRGAYREALAIEERVLVLRRETGNVNGAALAMDNLGMMHTALGEYGLAQERFSESLPLLQETGNKRGYANALNGVGMALARTGAFDRALDYHRRALELAERLGNKLETALSLSNIGYVLVRTGRPGEAREEFNRGLAIARQAGDAWGEAEALGNMGWASVELGECLEALEFFQESLACQVKIGCLFGAVFTLVAKCFAAIGGEGSAAGKITALTATAADPEAFFDRAIGDESLQRDYASVVDALREYGWYLCGTGRVEAGLERLGRARKQAEEAGMAVDVERIDALLYAVRQRT